MTPCNLGRCRFCNKGLNHRKAAGGSAAGDLEKKKMMVLPAGRRLPFRVPAGDQATYVYLDLWRSGPRRGCLASEKSTAVKKDTGTIDPRGWPRAHTSFSQIDVDRGMRGHKWLFCKS
jgi:hypothetical protein